jgi:hypothetical protein
VNGVGFSVLVEAVDGADVLMPVNNTTDFTITLETGAGMLFGNLSSFIPDGETGTLVTGVVYDTDAALPESGVSIRVNDEPGGEMLTDDVSNTFDVLGADLVVEEVAVEVTPTQTNVIVTYTVHSLSATAAFDLTLGLSTDGVDTDFEAALVTFPILARTPGTHMTPAQDVRAALDALAPTRVKHGDKIIADIDLGNTVPEPDDTNNVAASAGLVVDVIANSVSVAVAGAMTEAAVSYTIVAPAMIDAFTIQLGIDTDDNGTINTNLGAAFAAPTLTPGTFMATQDIRPNLDALVTKVKHGDNIVVAVDSGSDIGEQSESNNTEDSADLVVDVIANAVSVAVPPPRRSTRSPSSSASTPTTTAPLTPTWGLPLRPRR